MTDYGYAIDPRPAELGGGWRLRLLENGEEVGGGVFPLSPYLSAFPATDEATEREMAEGGLRGCLGRGVRVARHPARRRGTGLSGRRRPVRRSADPHHPAQVLNTLEALPPDLRPRRREARGAVLAGCALCPAPSRTGYWPSRAVKGPCPRPAGCGPHQPLDCPSWPSRGSTARFRGRQGVE